MSANIAIHKLKFEVFGRGYDDERGNSGSGAKEPDIMPFNPNYACFSADGKYCWVVNSNWNLYKYDTSTWQTADKGSISGSVILRPYNVYNNLGMTQGGEGVILFDLNTNEVVYTSPFPSYTAFGNDAEITLDEENEVVNFAHVNKRRQSKGICLLDYTNHTSSSIVIYDAMINGFINTNYVYAKYIAEWFSQWDYAYSQSVSGSGWGLRPTDETTHSFPYISSDTWGLTGNGKLYLPSFINGKWVMGVYNATSSAPDLNTPSPNDYYGQFESRPSITDYVTYTNGKTKGAFLCGEGMFVCDFVNRQLIKLTDEQRQPVAMTDNLVLCRGGYLYEY